MLRVGLIVLGQKYSDVRQRQVCTESLTSNLHLSLYFHIDQKGFLELAVFYGVQLMDIQLLKTRTGKNCM